MVLIGNSNWILETFKISLFNYTSIQDSKLYKLI